MTKIEHISLLRLPVPFDNRFLRALPADPSHDNSPRQVFSAAYSRVQPTAVSQPELLAWSSDLANSMQLPAPDQSWIEALAGNSLIGGMESYATCYGGHQFGNWANQLGDGRAIALGEWRNEAGEYFEMQLKGAGPTPYSRFADGRAVLRSSLREYVCSEAMHALGVPTTRALSLISTGDTIERDMFYDGNPQHEPGAIVCRVAPSFVRFGNFELAAAREDKELLKAWMDYSLATHFPDIDTQDPQAWYLCFDEIARRTARLIVDWMRVGFVHGVMNTDNMSIHGITIDYGPYGWLEPYEPSWTPNTTDAQGRRYCFGNQPAIAQWNLACLGSALAQIASDTQRLQSSLELYAREYKAYYAEKFALKLGVEQLEEDDELLSQMFDFMQKQKMDYCLWFRQLGQLRPEDLNNSAGFLQQMKITCYEEAGLLSGNAQQDISDWLARYKQARQENPLSFDEQQARMNRVNPKFIPRNYLCQVAIEAAEQGDNSELQQLLKVLEKPYEEQPEHESYAARRPAWAENKAGCSALSCSS